MKFFQDNVLKSVNSDVSYDAGLRSYMINVYNYMFLGLVITALASMVIVSSPALTQAVHGTLLSYVFMFAPLGIVLYLSFKIQSMSVSAARTAFIVFAATMGISLSYIFLLYTATSITRAFFVSAALFASMSLYGYTTKKDLTSLGSFLIMGVIGIVLASLVNLFLKSSGLSYIISILAVIIFTGLTAYDTQKIKQTYFSLAGHEDGLRKATIMGALALYMDFINLFIHLLRLFGERK